MNNIAEDKLDYNGFSYIEKNPISKVGVFPYLGRQISPLLEPNNVYYVYRPAEELFKEETMDSFKLVPFTDEHTMLGTSEGMIPAEKKGVHGTTGEEITHDEDTLYSNLKIFSEDLKEKIKNGKKEISLGYYCDYDLQPGEYKGQHYDAIQKNILGNHVALVKQGRMGSDVRVMDSLDLLTNFNNFTNNSNKKEEMVDKRKDISEVEAMLYEAKKDPAKLNDELIKTILQKFENNSYEPSETSKVDDEKIDEVKDEDIKNTEEKSQVEKEETKDEDIKDKLEDTKDGCDEDDEENKSVSMDEMFNIIAERDELYNSVKKHTGEFDYKRMNSQQICKYACDCLNISSEKGQEMATLKGYLQGRKNEKRYSLDENISYNNNKVDKAFEDYLK